MCLIIFSPKSHQIPVSVIESALRNNEDGVGIMYWSDTEQKPIVWKSPNATLKEIVKLTEDLTDITFAIHFRMRTHGKIDYENTHPYKIVKHRYLMHNGILSNKTAKGDPNHSDTWNYIQNRIRPAVFNQTLDWDEIEKDIGRHNKFVVLEKGEFKILNETHGEWYEGAWYSNTYAWDFPHWDYPETIWGNWNSNSRNLSHYEYPTSTNTYDTDYDLYELYGEVQETLTELIFAGELAQNTNLSELPYDELSETIQNLDAKDCIALLKSFRRSLF